ncbi:MAG TPA: YitT family protein, partial [Syntrophomonadaceae bacterium]|nr:YitT family protein [Syntrophomonadaceae bacterium]
SISKTVLIVSNRSDDIAPAILEVMHRGCTIIDGKGAYTGDQKHILMVTVGKTQLPRLKEIVFQVDPHAFMTINESIEVYGQGFKSSKADF